MQVRGRHLPLLRKAELITIGFFLLLFSQALLGRLFATADNPEGGAILRFLWLPIYAYAAVAVVAKWREISAIIVRSPGLFLLSFMAVASMLWSIDPSTSLRRGIAIFFTTLFGYYMAATLSWKEMIRMFGIVWLILAVGNFLAGALAPGFGRDYEIHIGAWKGLWFEKNSMGGNFARASFLFGFLILVDDARRKLWSFSLLISIALVLLSTSKTSLLGMMLGFGILFLYVWMKQGKVVAISTIWIGTVSAVAAALVVVLAPQAVVALIGRDLTLTGRTDIWDVLFMVMADRPWLGFGYGAFWQEGSEPAYMVWRETQWLVPTAHNGVLDVMLALGRIGAILFLFDFILNFGRALFTLNKRVTSLFAIGSFAMFALFSISESVILQQNNILWVTYAAIVGKLSLEASARSADKQARRRQRLNRHRAEIRVQ